MKWDDTNKVVSRYFIFCFMTAVVFPPGLRLAEMLGVNPARLPIYRWIATVPGVLPHYQDYFLVMWAVFPIWLGVFGWVYAKNYSSNSVNVPILVAASVVLLLLVVGMLAADVQVGQVKGQWRHGVLILAANIRLIGAFLFSCLMLFVFALLSISIVKMPVDLMRKISILRGRNSHD